MLGCCTSDVQTCLQGIVVAVQPTLASQSGAALNRMTSGCSLLIVCCVDSVVASDGSCVCFRVAGLGGASVQQITRARTADSRWIPLDAIADGRR